MVRPLDRDHAQYAIGATWGSHAYREVARVWSNGWHSEGALPRPVLPYTGYSFHGELVRACLRTDGYPQWTYSASPDPPEGAHAAARGRYVSASHFPKALNRSWDKLMDEVKGSDSSLGTTLAEGREAFDLMVRRATSLRRAYTALRKGDPRRFFRELSVDPKRKHRSIIRTASHEAAGMWLEYWFGWAPMIQDLHDSAMVTANSMNYGRIRLHGTGAQRLPWTLGAQVDDGQRAWEYRRRIDAGALGIVKQGATFWVSNPNAFLANRLGLTNPVAIAWELVPFSFVVDWFTKFGNVLNSWTDLVGVSYVDPYTTTISRWEALGEFGRTDRFQGVYRTSGLIRWKGVSQRRTTSLTKPMVIPPRIGNFGHSHTRAATAVSLLIAVFTDS